MGEGGFGAPLRGAPQDGQKAAPGDTSAPHERQNGMLSVSHLNYYNGDDAPAALSLSIFIVIKKHSSVFSSEPAFLATSPLRGRCEGVLSATSPRPT